jgi:hypothetical protein
MSNPCTFIDWVAVAKRHGFPSETAMWSELYSERRLGIVALATKFGVGPRTIRRSLIRCGIPLHPKGPPPLREYEVEPREGETLLQAAIRQGVPYSTLWHRRAKARGTLLSRGQSEHD